MKRALLRLQWSAFALSLCWVFTVALTRPFNGPDVPAKSAPTSVVMPKFRLSDPPVFADTVPNDTTINCLGDLPPGLARLANDDLDGMILVNPVDSPDPMMISPCTGDTILRIWTAIDMENNITADTQRIIVLPDIGSPFIDFPELNDTSVCEGANYDKWINDIRIALYLGNVVSDSCSGLNLLATTEMSPATFTEPCASAFVTFIFTDNCGNNTVWEGTYTTIDTLAPELIGIPAIPDTISCSDPIPAAALVTAVDNCTPNLIPSFSEVSTQQMSGNCSQYNYTITRTWTVEDSCGNRTTDTHDIVVRDLTAPDFNLPPDITISCDQDSSDINITGNISGISDNCSPSDSIDINFVDQIQTLPGANCALEYLIVRNWQAVDICGNLRVKQQLITVRDTEAPDFTPPPNITVDCDDANDLEITGEPTNLLDSCDPFPDVHAEPDVIIPGTCPNAYTIRRTWTSEDACGNTQSVDQFITVTDLVPPVFETEPEYLILNCTDNLDVAQAFNDWISNHGGAQAEDNCSQPNELAWLALNAGTNTPATLGAPTCPSSSDTILVRMIDFIVQDECGNRDTTTAAFMLVDNAAPVLSECPDNQTVRTDAGQCQATFTLEPPLITDACAVAFQADTLHAAVPLTSNAIPGQETDTPVNPVNLDFLVNLPLPINAAGNGTLVIQLINTDAEEPTEYFVVRGEDGTQIGLTNHTLAQCGASVTAINLSVAQINAWAVDGVISIRLEPNIPQGLMGRFSVNPICVPQSMVVADIYYTSKTLAGINYSYRIDDGSLVSVAPIAEATEVLPLGNSIITYFASDCSGRTDSCSYTVTVEDLEPPVLTCPSSLIVNADPGECEASVTLPLPPAASDNCSVFDQQGQTLPADTASAYLTFDYDPNLNDYIANNRTITFTNLAANAFGPVTLSLDLRGDFNTNQAFMRVFGEGGMLIGTTNIGVASCAAAGQQSFSIPAATFNSWVVDGQLAIQLTPNPISVPPGVAGDGISPCVPLTANGQTDSISYVFAHLSYNSLTPSYYATGVNSIPLTVMQAPAIAPTHIFNVGQTTINYIIPDAHANKDTCSFVVTIVDNQPPTALCQATTLFINPSGLDVQTISPDEINAGSTDNCGITNLTLSPNTFTCSQAGSVVNVTLTAADAAGNISSCNTIVGITAEAPLPTANSGLCGGDTLFLFANPPPAVGGIIFTYRWYNPLNQLISTVQNPVITNIDSGDEGPYRVEIRGITGCVAENVVIVNIENLPLAPSILTSSSVCSVDNIVLNSSIFPSGNNVIFRWYEGTAPNGTLIGTTTQPTFTLPGPHPLGTRTFYLTVEANGCQSAPSQAVAVTAVQKPVAMATFADTTACGGQSITLGTLVAGPGLTYNWAGPNTFSSNAQFPVLSSLDPTDEGYYYLTISRSGCSSAPDSVLVNVKPKPATPTISSSGPACAGANVVLTTPATGASTYHWISNTNQEFLTSIPVFIIQNANTAQSGPWRVFVTKNECDSDPSAPVQVVINPVPDAAASASPAQICEGATLNLFGSPSVVGALYQWTGPDGFDQVTANPSISAVELEDEGLYRLRITTTAGCTDTASVFVNVLESVSIQGISSNAPACIDGPTNIQLTSVVFPADNGSYSYKWTGPNMYMSTAAVANIPSATAATANGNYSLVVTTAQGCATAPLTYVLDANDSPAAPQQPASIDGANTYCIGDEIRLTTNNFPGNSVVYYWQLPGGVNALTSTPLLEIDSALTSNSGDYLVYVIVDGCISPVSAPRPISVYTIPTISVVNNSPVCAGDNLSFEAFSGPNASFAWGGPSGFTSGVPNPVIMNALPLVHSGLYQVAATINGCTSDTISIVGLVKARPQAPSAVNNGPICINDPLAALNLSVSLGSATAGATYIWYGSDGTTPISTPASDLNFLFTDFSNFSEGAFPFFVQASLNGCTSSLSEATQATFNTIPNNQAFAGLDTTVCDNQTAQLSGATPTIGTGLWSLVSAGNPIGVAIANPSQPNTSVNGLQVDGGPYLFRWTLSNGACVNYSFDDMLVNVSQGDTADAGDNFAICLGDVINLSALPPAGASTGVWTQPIAQQILGVSIQTPGNPSSVIAGLEADNLYSFTWTVSSTCGISSDEVFITVSASPEGGPDAIACNDEGDGVLSAGQPTLGSTGAWTALDPDVVIDEPQNRNTAVHNLQNGVNAFVWTIDNALCGEASRDTVIVFYKELPWAEPDLFSIPFGTADTFNVLPNDFTPPGTFTEVIEAPDRGVLENLGDGLFRFTPPANFVGTAHFVYQINSEGCIASTGNVTILIGEGAACVAPSIITPNNDGVNDNFVVPCLLDTDLFPNSQVRIFNRWGDEVFSSPTPYLNDWNGTFNSEDLPADTYFFIIDFGNGDEPLSGWVMIQR